MAVRLRETGFRLRPHQELQSHSQLTALYAEIAQDEKQSEPIFADVPFSLEARRRPVILTVRRDHPELLASRFATFTRHLVVLLGGMNAAERRAAEAALNRPDTQACPVIATGRCLGEGFDDGSLDTLFLTMPISCKGILAQDVGRLHREHHAKREVIVDDYVDFGVPILATMASRRQAGYRSLESEVGR